MQNALAVAGVLGIDINLENVCLYTVYRNDKLNDFANPAKLRCKLHDRQERKDSKECEDWNDKEAGIVFLDKDKFQHNKIKLDAESGRGVYKI